MDKMASDSERAQEIAAIKQCLEWLESAGPTKPIGFLVALQNSRERLDAVIAAVEEHYLHQTRVQGLEEREHLLQQAETALDSRINGILAEEIFKKAKDLAEQWETRLAEVKQREMALAQQEGVLHHLEEQGRQLSEKEKELWLQEHAISQAKKRDVDMSRREEQARAQDARLQGISTAVQSLHNKLVSMVDEKISRIESGFKGLIPSSDVNGKLETVAQESSLQALGDSLANVATNTDIAEINIALGSLAQQAKLEVMAHDLKTLSGSFAGLPQQSDFTTANATLTKVAKQMKGLVQSVDGLPKQASVDGIEKALKAVAKRSDVEQLSTSARELSQSLVGLAKQSDIEGVKSDVLELRAKLVAQFKSVHSLAKQSDVLDISAKMIEQSESIDGLAKQSDVLDIIAKLNTVAQHSGLQSIVTKLKELDTRLNTVAQQSAIQNINDKLSTVAQDSSIAGLSTSLGALARQTDFQQLDTKLNTVARKTDLENLAERIKKLDNFARQPSVVTAIQQIHELGAVAKHDDVEGLAKQVHALFDAFLGWSKELDLEDIADYLAQGVEMIIAEVKKSLDNVPRRPDVEKAVQDIKEIISPQVEVMASIARQSDIETVSARISALAERFESQEALNNARKELSERDGKHQAETKGLRQRIATIMAEKEQFEEEVPSLKGAIKNLQDAVKKKSSLVPELEKERDEAKQRLAEAKTRCEGHADLVTANREHVQRQDQLVQDITTLNIQLTTKDDECHSLLASNTALEQELETVTAALEEQIQAKDDERHSLLASNTALEEQIQAKDDECNSLLERNTTLEQELETERSTAAALRAQVEALQQSLDQRAAAEQERDELEQTLDDVTRQKDELTGTVKALRQENTTLSSERNDLENSLPTARQDYDELESEKDKLLITVLSLEETHAEIAHGRDMLQGQVLLLQTRVEDLTCDIEDMYGIRAERDAFAMEASWLRSDKTALNAQLASLGEETEKTRTSLMRELEAKSLAHDALSQLNSELQQQRQRLDSELSAARDEHKEAIAKMVEELSESRTKSAQLESQLSAARIKVTQLEKEESRLQEETKRLEIQVKERGEQITSLQAEVTKAKTSQDAAAKLEQELSQQVKELNGRVNEQKARLTDSEKKIKTLNTNLGESRGHTDLCNNMIQELNGKLAHLGRNLSAEQGKVESLIKELSEANSMVMELRQQVSGADDKVQKAEAEAAELRTDLQSKITECLQHSELASGCNTLREQLALSEKKCETLDQVTTKCHELEEAIKVTKAEHQAAVQRAETLEEAVRAEQEANPRKRRRLNENESAPGELSGQEKWEQVIYKVSDEMAQLAPETQGVTHERVFFELNAISLFPSYQTNWDSFMANGSADQWYCLQRVVRWGHTDGAAIQMQDNAPYCSMHQQKRCVRVKILRPDGRAAQTLFTMAPAPPAQ